VVRSSTPSRTQRVEHFRKLSSTKEVFVKCEADPELAEAELAALLRLSYAPRRNFARGNLLKMEGGGRWIGQKQWRAECASGSRYLARAGRHARVRVRAYAADERLAGGVLLVTEHSLDHSRRLHGAMHSLFVCRVRVLRS
jgi:hypothetical protein